ncbi:hypothetical protein D3C84_1126670 [compost metagenome]
MSGEDLRIVADGPAFLVIDKEHAGQHLPRRYARLHPVAPGIVGEQDMAAITHRHQTLAHMGDVQQQAAHGFR